MFSIRKPWWAALTAAALVAGCSGEESTTPDVTPGANATSPGSRPGPAPETPSSAVKSDAAKIESAPAPVAPGPAGTTKSEPAKDESAAPKIEAPKIEAPKPDSPKTESPKTDSPKTASVSLTGDEVAEVKKLPADEQAVALKQVVCPVSDEHLGSMGTPIKVVAEGKTFYLCCKSCKKDVDADPKAVVAKLAKK